VHRCTASLKYTIYATILTGFQPKGTYPGPTRIARKKLYNVRTSQRKNTITLKRDAADVTGNHSKRHMKDDQVMTAISDSANIGPQCSNR